MLNQTSTVAHSYGGNYLSLFYALPDSGTTKHLCLYDNLEVQALLPRTPEVERQPSRQPDPNWRGQTNFTDGTLQWAHGTARRLVRMPALTVTIVGTNNVAYDTIGSGAKFLSIDQMNRYLKNFTCTPQSKPV